MVPKDFLFVGFFIDYLGISMGFLWFSRMRIGHYDSFFCRVLFVARSRSDPSFSQQLGFCLRSKKERC